jgi:hypothetical protein
MYAQLKKPKESTPTIADRDAARASERSGFTITHKDRPGILDRYRRNEKP